MKAKEKNIEPKEIAQLRITNNVFTHDGNLWIEINIPDDFIYNLEGLYVVYEHKLEYQEVNGKIPDDILVNMNQFNNRPVKQFVEFLERNLDTFCAGKIPEEEPEQLTGGNANGEGECINDTINNNSCINDPKKIRELKNYKFKFNSSISPNLRIDALKNNITVFMCETLNIIVKCNRCKSNVKLTSKEDDEYKCSDCNAPIIFTYIPVFSPGWLGLFHIKHCQLVLVDSNRFRFSCSECSAAYETGPLSTNKKYQYSCFHCHSAMSFSIDRIVHITQKKVMVKEGTELPEKGTCKHYSKSYRWFRFPCCNSLYPCDVCHDEESNHPNELAVRMVCGYCSKEQSVKKDCECGMSLKKKHSQFWEGGKGNRNKATLNKNDRKKNTK